MVGPSLLGHAFTEGVQVLRGRTCPWNTAALWNVSKLALIGFPMVGDGVPGHVGTAGVEVSSRDHFIAAQSGVQYRRLLLSFCIIQEVSAVAVLQQIQPHVRAVLLYMEGRVSWNVSDFDGDEERRLYHELKMTSKDYRPAAQLEALGITGKGDVQHIIYHG